VPPNGVGADGTITASTTDDTEDGDEREGDDS
jgi:hypothetical protein